MLATSPQLVNALNCRNILFTLLTAGAAYIQNNVFLGVNSDKVSALKGQVARWKMNVQERMDEQLRQDNFNVYFIFLIITNPSRGYEGIWICVLL